MKRFDSDSGGTWPMTAALAVMALAIAAAPTLGEADRSADAPAAPAVHAAAPRLPVPAADPFPRPSREYFRALPDEEPAPTF